jgi:hypothetical protein
MKSFGDMALNARCNLVDWNGIQDGQRKLVVVMLK